MGPVQFSRLREEAENWFTKLGFGGAFCEVSLGKKHENIEFTKVLVNLFPPFW